MNKKIIVIRDASYHLPPIKKLAADVKVVYNKILESKTLVYLAEFYDSFILQLKAELGLKDIVIANSEVQIRSAVEMNQDPEFVALGILQYSSELYTLKTTDKGTVTDLKISDFVKYLITQDFKPDEFLKLDRANDIWTYDDAIYIGDTCKNVYGTPVITGQLTDFQLGEIFDGKRFQNLVHLELSSLNETSNLITPGGLTLVLKNLPNLKYLGLFNPLKFWNFDFQCLLQATSLEAFTIGGKNRYVPTPGLQFFFLCLLIIFR